MSDGSVALGLAGVMWVLFALWVWIIAKFMENARKVHGGLRGVSAGLKALESRLNAVEAVYDEQFRVMQKACAVGPVERRVEALEKRVAGAEALLVSTVGQETEDFCRQMEGIMARMEKPEQKEKFTLSREFCGNFGKEKESRR